MFWICAGTCKEVVFIPKERQTSVKEALRMILHNKNHLMIIACAILNMTATMGRIGVAVYFSLYAAQTGNMTTLFMMFQMLMSVIVLPFAPKFMEKFGYRKVIYFSLASQTLGLLMMVIGPCPNIPYLILCQVILGFGGGEKACSPCMIVDALDGMDLRTGIRTDRTAFSLMGPGTKIGSAIGSAVCMMIIGAYGCTNGTNITAHMQSGIMIAANAVPIIPSAAAIILMRSYSLKEDMAVIRRKLKERNAKKEEV